MYNRTQLQMFIVIYIYAVWVNIQSNRFLCISSSQIQSQESCCPPFPLYVLNEHLFLLKHTGFIDYFSMCSLGVLHTFTSSRFPRLFTSLTYWWLRQPSHPKEVCLAAGEAEHCCFLHLRDPLQAFWLTNNSFSSRRKNARAEISLTLFTFMKSDAFFMATRRLSNILDNNMKTRQMCLFHYMTS